MNKHGLHDKSLPTLEYGSLDRFVSATLIRLNRAIGNQGRNSYIMDSLIKDIRYAVRGLIKRPGFVAIAVITLALGIGANTAIFSLVNTVLLRSLPVDRPGEIVSVAVRGKDDSLSAFSYPNYKDFRDRNEVLSGLLVYRFVPLSLSRDGVNERVWGYRVSGNYFDVLNVKAIQGRTFLPEEDKTPLSHPVVVLSYDSWQRRFGGDPSLVGRDVLINNHQFRVIGIAPQGFKGTEFVYTPEIWLPAAMMEWAEPGATWLNERGSKNFFGSRTSKARCRSTQAEASLNLLGQQLAQRVSGHQRRTIDQSWTNGLHSSGFARRCCQLHLGDDGSGWSGAARYVHESCRTHARARDRSTSRDRDSSGDGRESVALDPAASYRKYSAFFCWWRSRCVPRVVDSESIAGTQTADRFSARNGCRSRLASVVVLSGCVDRSGSDLRIGASVTSHATKHHDGIERHSRAGRRCENAFAKCSRRCTDRDIACGTDRGRAGCAHTSATTNDEPGFRSE